MNDKLKITEIILSERSLTPTERIVVAFLSLNDGNFRLTILAKTLGIPYRTLKRTLQNLLGMNVVNNREGQSNGYYRLTPIHTWKLDVSTCKQAEMRAAQDREEFGRGDA